MRARLSPREQLGDRFALHRDQIIEIEKSSADRSRLAREGSADRALARGHEPDEEQWRHGPG